MFQERRRRVVQEASKHGCSHVIAATPQNIYYLTGFWGGGYLILHEEEARLFTGQLEGGRAQDTACETEVTVVPRGVSVLETVASSLKDVGRVCMDDSYASLFNSFSKKIGGGLICLPEVFALPRRVKDQGEVSALIEGGKIVDKIYQKAHEVVRQGVTERKVEGELILAALEWGCNIPGFNETLNPFIVASGPNSAYPHAALSDRIIEDGDFVVIDSVVRYKGYVVDTTRTFAVASANTEMEKVYQAVQEAQAAGFEKARPGVPAKEVDGATRGVLEREGYAGYFLHSTGHGIGIDVHEMPRVSLDSEDVLLRGEALTVEPGLYFKGRFGVRIEDSLLVDESPRMLTSYPRDLIIVG